MSDYERLQDLLRHRPFVTVNMPMGTAEFAAQGKVFKSLLRDNPLDCSTATINAKSALAGFAALRGVGTEDKEFSIDDIAKIAGMERITAHNYVSRGIFRPSVSGRTGSPGGQGLRFSWRDGYVAGLVGAFRRIGLVPYLLQQVSDLFYEDNQQKRTGRKGELAARS